MGPQVRPFLLTPSFTVNNAIALWVAVQTNTGAADAETLNFLQNLNPITTIAFHPQPPDRRLALDDAIPF